MASITPLVSTSNSEQTTTTRDTLVDSTESIAGASLENGVDYLVLYSIAYGGGDQAAGPDTGSRTSVVVTHGENIIAKGRDESEYFYETAFTMTGHNLCGSYVITGDGSNPLKVQFRCMSSGDTAYIKGSTLIAIPLDDLTENQDYFYAQQNGDTAESTAVISYVTVLEDTFSAPENGDYLVLASMEAGISSGGASTEGYAMKLLLNSVTQKQEFLREYEDDAAAVSFSYARIHTLTSGNNTLTLRGGPGQGTGAITTFRRGRLFVFNLSSFDQYDTDTSDGETEVTDSYPTYTDLLTSSTFDPTQEEYVLVIGNVFSRTTNDNYPQVGRLKNETDTTYFGDFCSTTTHDNDFDRSTLTVFGVEQIDTPGKAYKFQVSARSAASYSSYFKYPDLIILGLTTAGAGGSYTKTLTETAVASAWRAEGGSSYAITLEEGAQASHAITIPHGPTYYVAPGPLGDDNNLGTSSGAPWRTLQKAASTVPPGAWVYVADGEYDGCYFTDHVATAASITQFIASGSSAIINDHGDGWKHPFFGVEGSSRYIRLDGFIFDGTGYSWSLPYYPGSAIRILESYWVEIANCTIQNMTGAGIFTGESGAIRAIDSIFANIGSYSSGLHAIYYGWSTDADPCRDMVVQGCTFNTQASGVNPIHWNPATTSSGSDNTIRDSILDGNTFNSNDTYIVNMNGAINCQITNNIWYGQADGSYALRFFAESDGTYDDDQRPPCHDNIVANNTIINPVHGGINHQVLSGMDSCYNQYIFNNIIITEQAPISGNTSAQKISPNNITGDYTGYDFDSLFVDHDNNDYHILETSIAHEPPTGLASYLGKAAPSTDFAGVTRPQGSFFDIGAYEIYHSSGPYAKTLTETGMCADTQSGQKWLSRELTETAVATQTYNRVGTIFSRVLSEVARTIETMWAITAEKPAEYILMIFSEVGRGAATLARVLTGAREHTETAVASDTLDRTGTIISRIHTETALGDDSLFDSESPGPGDNILTTVGYVTNGIVEVETG